jgi:hypothetical protein
MPGLTLKALLSPRSGSRPALAALLETMKGDICIVDPLDKPLLGAISNETSIDQSRVPSVESDIGLVGPRESRCRGFARYPPAARDSEPRPRFEILHLCPVHLIEQLSGTLAALLDLPAVSQWRLAKPSGSSPHAVAFSLWKKPMVPCATLPHSVDPRRFRRPALLPDSDLPPRSGTWGGGDRQQLLL